MCCMETNPIENIEKHRAELLGKINTAIASLGSNRKWNELPEFLPEYKLIKGKRVLMVDDSTYTIEDFIPYLMVATDGNMQFVLHKEDQTSGGLLRAILDSKPNPDIVLLDYSLANGVEGPNIAEHLQIGGFEAKIFGFSSESDYKLRFKRAGFGFVYKSSTDLEGSVKNLARLLENQKT